jgi:hypothetical protein
MLWIARGRESEERIAATNRPSDGEAEQRSNRETKGEIEGEAGRRNLHTVHKWSAGRDLVARGETKPKRTSISSSSKVGSTTEASMISVEMYPFVTAKASMMAKKAVLRANGTACWSAKGASDTDERFKAHRYRNG